MKRIIGIALTIIALLAMTVPAMAAPVPASVTVGTSTGAPAMVALAMTPDDSATTPGTQRKIEPAIPNPVANPQTPPLFPNTDPSKDGWQQVKFYVEAFHVNGNDAIKSVAIDVKYPTTFGNWMDDAMFGAVAAQNGGVNRAGTLKFEINAFRDPNSSTGWSATTSYPYASVTTYPDGTLATPPAIVVRPLVWHSTVAPTQDIVNVDDLDNLGPAPDVDWQTFLTNWGQKVAYNTPTYNADSAYTMYHLGQTLVLEISGWFWFHQPGVDYAVTAMAGTDTASSGTLGNTLSYMRQVSLFLDFSNVGVNYGTVAVGQDNWAQGDTSLGTPLLTTIWDNGNENAQVSVNSTKMLLEYAGQYADIFNEANYSNPAKNIATFDAKLYYTKANLDVVQIGYIAYPADTKTLITNTGIGGGTGNTGPVLLQACRPAKIEFSVHPETGEGQVTGTWYKGFLTISGDTYAGGQIPQP